MSRNAAHRQFLVFAVLGLLITVLAGCSSAPRHYDQSVDDKGRPQWVVHGTQTSKTKRGRIFLGVGVVQIQGDFSRQANTANARARDELARMLNRFIEVVARDYIASGEAQSAGFMPNEAPRYINDMTSLALSRAEVLDHWVDQSSNKIFASAQISYPRVHRQLADSSRVNSGFKRYLNQHGEQVFDRIATEH
jgi:hypothetical protein